MGAKLAILFILPGVCFGESGHCKFLSAKYAAKAFTDLSALVKAKEIPVIDKYCASCNDPYVKPIVIEKVGYKPHQVKGYASISINDKEVDLAYLYLNGRNLGYTYHCKTQAATEYLFQENLEP